MSNLLNLKDVVESALAVAIFPIVLLVPGYLFLWGRAQACGVPTLPKKLSEALMSYVAVTTAFYCVAAALASVSGWVFGATIFPPLPVSDFVSALHGALLTGLMLIVAPSASGAIWGRMSLQSWWVRLFRRCLGRNRLRSPAPAWPDLVEIVTDEGEGRIVRITTTDGAEYYGFSSDKSLLASDANLRDIYLEPLYSYGAGGELRMDEGRGVFLRGDVVSVLELIPPSMVFSARSRGETRDG